MVDKEVDKEPLPSGMTHVLRGNKELEGTLGITLFMFGPVAPQGTQMHRSTSESAGSVAKTAFDPVCSHLFL